MARITTLLLGAGLVALQGCSAAPGDEPVSSNEANVTGGSRHASDYLRLGHRLLRPGDVDE